MLGTELPGQNAMDFRCFVRLGLPLVKVTIPARGHRDDVGTELAEALRTHNVPQ